MFICTSPDNACNLYQVSSVYLKGFQSNSADRTSGLKFTRGQNSVKMKMELHNLFSAQRLIMFYICKNFPNM